MKVTATLVPERRHYAARFEATDYEARPFIDTLHFWGMETKPDPLMSALGLCIVAAKLPIKTVQFQGLSASPYFCEKVGAALGLQVFPAKLHDGQRKLLGGDLALAPHRYARPHSTTAEIYAQPMSWTGTADFRGTIGGTLRSNIDVFDLTETEKDLVIGLCTGGDRTGTLIVPTGAESYAPLFHALGLHLLTV